MPALEQFQHIAGKLQHTPYPSIPIQYGANKQHATQESKVHPTGVQIMLIPC
jgi:hypothetical protein